MLFLIIILVICAVAFLSISLLPGPLEKMQEWRLKKEQGMEKELDKLFYEKSPRQLMRLYFILPPILGIAGYLLFQSALFLFIGALLGLFVPNLILKIRQTQRRQKFNVQILDMIMILSSSLKSGLSLLQALEVVMEEMAAPMSQEIGLAVRENKMGLTLEQSLHNLSKRINMEELDLVINSILVARETGGDLTKVLSRLSTTLRDNRKLKENIKSLTMQGKMQGAIMSFLPFLFIWWVLSFNRNHFDVMLQSDTGRTLLIVAAVLQVVGMILIKRFSTVRI